jgi:hypothetical protein
LEPPAEEVEGATPPGYDWPTHGGYLGCLVGLVAGCLIGASLTPPIFNALHAARLILPGPGFFLVLAVVLLGSVIAVGRLGYALGRRFYHYYPQPRPTWGESDVAADALGSPPASELPAGEEMPASEHP